MIPALPLISGSDEAEMEEFIANSKLFIGTLGHNILKRRLREAKRDPMMRKYFI